MKLVSSAISRQRPSHHGRLATRHLPEALHAQGAISEALLTSDLSLPKHVLSVAITNDEFSCRRIITEDHPSLATALVALVTIGSLAHPPSPALTLTAPLNRLSGH